MKKISFKIQGMDCAEEVAVLKREVGPLLANGEESLSFDLINGKMTACLDDPSVTGEVIQKAVAKTGMKAVEYSSTEESAGAVNHWQRSGRTIFCALSGAFLIIGFLSHAMNEGSIFAALTSGEEGEHVFSGMTLFLYLGAVLTGGWFIFPKALFAARKLKPDMNLLMTVAVVGAMLINEWFEAAAVTFLFSLALLLETWSVGRARRAIKALVDISPVTARYMSPELEGVWERRVEEVPVGVTVLVRPGEKVPLDGVVIKGSTTINQAPITGESMSVPKEPGDDVFAGTINGDGAFEFRSTKPASDTTLARIIHMVEEAQSRRAPSEQWVEKFAASYTPVMMGLTLFIAVTPPVFFGGDWNKWIYEALVILVIACPCALVISTPVSIVSGLTAATRAGVLIKGGIYLEIPARLKAIALDKTGTLTYGKPVVQVTVPLNNHTERELLAYAASLEVNDNHPLARAIVEKAEAHGIEYTPAENFSIMQGKGAMGTIGGKKYWIGSHRMMEEMGMEDSDFHKVAVRMEDAGHSVIALCTDDHICGLIGVADRVRDEAGKAVRGMKSLGVFKIIMLTGDNQRTAEVVASMSGVDEFRAELLPEDKVKAVSELRENFGNVAMVGDGVNDAPAMAAATMGIAMGAMGSDAAIETADVALMSDDLSRLSWLIQHSRRTLGIIKQNIAFALGLKLVFIILALSGLATLWMAIAADMGASLFVIFNGLRLLKEKRS